MSVWRPKSGGHPITTGQGEQLPEIERSMTAAGLVVTYQSNDAARTLTILEIRPASPKP
jgi:hypothetical protein